MMQVFFPFAPKKCLEIEIQSSEREKESSEADDEKVVCNSKWNFSHT